jgi:hypothetical protein
MKIKKLTERDINKIVRSVLSEQEMSSNSKKKDKKPKCLFIFYGHACLHVCGCLDVDDSFLVAF